MTMDISKLSQNSAQGQLMWGRTVHFLQQPAQSPDLNTLDLGAWWSLETNVNELRYNPTWSSRHDRPHEFLADLNDAVLRSWKSWETSERLTKLQSTLFQNNWAVLACNGQNDYDRRSAPSNPSILQLKGHLRKARIDPIWSEARKMQ